MTYQDLWHRLTPLYDEGEAQAIVRLVLEVQFGITLTDIYTGKVNELSRNEVEELEKIILVWSILNPYSMSSDVKPFVDVHSMWHQEY